MAREISRLERPHSKCSRSVSVILRMDNLLLVMWSPGKNLRGCHGYPAYRYVSNFTVQFDVESVSSLLWNGCPVCRGMRVQVEPEFASLCCLKNNLIRQRLLKLKNLRKKLG